MISAWRRSTTRTGGKRSSPFPQGRTDCSRKNLFPFAGCPWFGPVALTPIGSVRQETVIGSFQSHAGTNPSTSSRCCMPIGTTPVTTTRCRCSRSRRALCDRKRYSEPNDMVSTGSRHGSASRGAASLDAACARCVPSGSAPRWIGWRLLSCRLITAPSFSPLQIQTFETRYGHVRVASDVSHNTARAPASPRPRRAVLPRWYGLRMLG